MNMGRAKTLEVSIMMSQLQLKRSTLKSRRMLAGFHYKVETLIQFSIMEET